MPLRRQPMIYSDAYGGAPELRSTRRDARLCLECESGHMRPYPEDPGTPCERDDCECWCNGTQERGEVK